MHSIKTKIVLTTVLIMGAFLLLLQLVWAPKMVSSGIETFEKTEQSKLVILGDAIKGKVLTLDLSSLHNALSEIENTTPSWKNLTLKLENGTRIYPLAESTVVGSNLKFLSVDITLEGKELATLSVNVDFSFVIDLVNDNLHPLHLGIILSALIFILVSLFMNYQLLFKPLNNLQAQAIEVANGNMHSGLRSDEKRKDEFGVFHQAFNLMLDNIEMRDKAIAEKQLHLLEQKNLAESASKSKSEFLASMSHEIRTPMNGLLGMAQLIKNSSLNPDQREQISVLIESGDSLMVILNEILDFSKIEAGKLSIEKTRFNLEASFNSVHQNFVAIAESKKIELQLVISDNLKNRLLYGDEVRIRQVINNLVSNAVKFTPQGGVYVHCSAELIGNEQVKIEFSVKDTGIGIAESKQSHVFEAFSQAESSTTRTFGGTGLGLSITSKLVELMGGTLSLKSEIGKGSTFIVELMLETISDERVVELITKETPTNTVETTKNENIILVVDDNKVNTMVLCMMLKKLGYQTESAVDGKIAVEMVEKNNYALIFMDYHMPVMDGKESTIAIRQLDSIQKETVIVGCTADAFEKTTNDLLASGQNDIIHKPIKIPALEAVLKKFNV